MDCNRLDEFYDEEMTDRDHAAFKSHLAFCPACQLALHANMQLSAAAMRRPGWVRRGVIRALEIADSCLDAHDAARETLAVVLGIADLARQAGRWAVMEAVRRVTPSPVREWIDWQNAPRAHWRTKCN